MFCFYKRYKNNISFLFVITRNTIFLIQTIKGPVLLCKIKSVGFLSIELHSPHSALFLSVSILSIEGGFLLTRYWPIMPLFTRDFSAPWSISGVILEQAPISTTTSTFSPRFLNQKFKCQIVVWKISLVYPFNLNNISISRKKLREAYNKITKPYLSKVSV